MMAMRMRGGAGGAGGAGGGSGQPRTGGGGWQGPAGAPPAGGGPPGEHGPGGPGGRGHFDLQQMLERMPPVQLSELKKGDALIISSSASTDPTSVTAINLVAGVEPFLAAAPRTAGGQVNLGSWSLDMGGGGMAGE